MNPGLLTDYNVKLLYEREGMSVSLLSTPYSISLIISVASYDCVDKEIYLRGKIKGRFYFSAEKSNFQ